MTARMEPPIQTEYFLSGGAMILILMVLGARAVISFCIRWHHHVPWYCRQDAEGDHCPCSQHHQDQDHCSSREEVPRLDRWLHPRLPVHLPADVDLQAGVRRVRTLHCPPQVLLNVCCFTVVLSSSHVLPSFVTTQHLYITMGSNR